MTDKIKDDWMNPQTSHVYSPQKRADGEVWLIQREKRKIVFGPSGSICQWEAWAEFATKDERDLELARLHKTTQWSLRGRRGYYRNGELHIYEPAWMND